MIIPSIVSSARSLLVVSAIQATRKDSNRFIDFLYFLVQGFGEARLPEIFPFSSSASGFAACRAGKYRFSLAGIRPPNLALGGQQRKLLYYSARSAVIGSSRA